MTFADIHSHILWGVDDGAKSAEQMARMLDAAYADGTRLLCLTPHFHPGCWGRNRERADRAFAQLQGWAAEKYPDLRLVLANELRWDRGCSGWLDEGTCRTLGGKYVLVDFYAGESGRTIAGGLQRLLSAGYVPILAHAERYPHLRGDLGAVADLRSSGVLIQITAGSLTGAFGLRTRGCARRLVKHGLADLVASDAHDMAGRKPGLSGAYRWIAGKYGTGLADRLCRKNAFDLLAPCLEEKEW